MGAHPRWAPLGPLWVIPRRARAEHHFQVRSVTLGYVSELDCLLGRDAVVSRPGLIAAGIGDAQIRRLVRADCLRRLRAGWFAAPNADPTVCRAVSLGGALSCVSALSQRGVWVPEREARVLHIRMNGYRRRGIRNMPGVRFCAGVGPTHGAVDDLESSVLAATYCLDGVELTAVFDSLLNKRIVGAEQLRHLLAGRSERVQRCLEAADGSAESGTETVLRLYFRARGIAYRTQVVIPGVGRVDFLVGRRLVVEADSRAHHAGDGIERDRDRDLEAHRRGFLPFRTSYQQVFYRFEAVAAALDAVLSRGEHLRPAEIDV